MSFSRPVTPPYIGVVCFRHCRILARMVVTEVVPDNVVVIEVIHDDVSRTEKTFKHVPTEIGAEEAEEVGAVGDVGV